jgi:hypothetical protein
MEDVIQITHESLLENDWKCSDVKNQKYNHAFYPDIILFLTKDYGIDNNYMIKLLSAPDIGETVNLNINCLTINDLRGLAHLFHKVSAVGLIKRLLINY